MIKAEFFDDEKISQISRDARLTFIGMWVHSDDYGVVKGHPAWLQSRLYPYDGELDGFQAWLKELEGIGVIHLFEVGGEKFYHIRNFLKHQVINRPSRQRNPEPPPQFNSDSASPHETLTEGSGGEHGIHTDEMEEERKRKYSPKCDCDGTDIQYSTIVDHLNTKCAKAFKATSRRTRSLIKARFNEGFHLDDFLNVINRKSATWANDSKMNAYLRPETLFGPKFESYLNESRNGSRPVVQMPDLTPKEFDFENQFKGE